MDNEAMMNRAKQLVVDYFNAHVDATDSKKLTMEDVFIGDKKETYLDVYKKWENQCIADGNTAH